MIAVTIVSHRSDIMDEVIAVTIVSHRSDIMDEGLAPATDGRRNRRTVAQAVGVWDTMGRKETSGSCVGLEAEGGPVRRWRRDRLPSRGQGGEISSRRRDPDRGVACLS